MRFVTTRTVKWMAETVRPGRKRIGHKNGFLSNLIRKIRQTHRRFYDYRFMKVAAILLMLLPMIFIILAYHQPPPKPKVLIVYADASLGAGKSLAEQYFAISKAKGRDIKLNQDNAMKLDDFGPYSVMSSLGYRTSFGCVDDWPISITPVNDPKFLYWLPFGLLCFFILPLIPVRIPRPHLRRNLLGGVSQYIRYWHAHMWLIRPLQSLALAREIKIEKGSAQGQVKVKAIQASGSLAGQKIRFQSERIPIKFYGRNRAR